ncbi:MAG: haloacid dehalogenase-like hydrolase [Candidatus Binatia bacterium]|nr:haloacid dehalogenase-like hydrolase [Candidatus Binatia bacterium]
MGRHLLLFDIDGTLIHADGAGRVALSRALSSEFDILDPRIVVGFAGRTDRAIATEALSSHGLEASEERFGRYLAAYLTHLPGTLVERSGRILPGARELLDALTTRDDVTLGILTGNFEGAANLKLEHFGLAEFFAGGGFGDHHHDRNDVARAAQSAFPEHAGADVTVWVIGDTPNDVRCARAIGARAVAVAAGFATHEELAAEEPDHLLADLCDVSDFLALLDDG